MKKIIYLVVTIVLVLAFTSARSTVTTDSRIGTKAPNFTIGNDSNVVTLNKFAGKYVLLTVWSSASAQSRLDNMRYNRLARATAGLEQLSVNFDRSRALFAEVVAADSLDASTQYYCEAQDRKTFEEKWGSHDQYNTFLINTRGVVVAINPGEKELAAAIK